MRILSTKAERRATVLYELEAGRISVEEAKATLGIERQQLARLRSRLRGLGPLGLNHGNLGRQPWHALGNGLCKQVVTLSQDSRYFGMKFHQFQQTLAERH